MSQTELAKSAGVSQTTVTAWETGKAEPSSSAVAKLADIFNVTTDYLLGRPNKQETKKDDVELSDDDVIMTWRGKPLSDEDRELIRRIMNGK
jgi:transcriptional regulator with XRE-family HTH domain